MTPWASTWFTATVITMLARRWISAFAATIVIVGSAACGSERQVELNAELQAELVEMMDADQAERTGQVAGNGDRARTERLAEIIDEHGWPIRSLVGTDGATAAWLIAQHSDQDMEFQERALELMRAAVDDEEADPTELAYLEDRVASNRGEPQIYGTQVSCVEGTPQPRPIADEEHVDERRAEVGLPPLSEYLEEMAAPCAEELENQEN